MNDLQTIKTHHDSLPGPAPQVAARAWDRLAAEAEAERAGGGPRGRLCRVLAAHTVLAVAASRSGPALS